MSISAARRGFGFLAAVSIALISTTAPVPAAEPGSGALYAASGSQSATVVRLGLGSGTQTPIANLISPIQGRSIYSLVADQGSPSLFGLAVFCACGKGGGVLVQQIATIDSQKSMFVLSPVVSPLMLQSGIVLDPSTHSLWAITFPSSVVRLDPTTGTETTVVASTPALDYGYSASMAFAPGIHTLYVTFAGGPPTGQLFSVDTVAGTISTGLQLSQPLSDLAYDPLSHSLFGISTSTRQQFVRIDTTTGAETALYTFSGEVAVTSLAIDTSTHTAFVAEVHINNWTTSEVFSINDQTGARSVSPSMIGPLHTLAFEAVAPVRT
jgi:hypothetical protein